MPGVLPWLRDSVCTLSFGKFEMPETDKTSGSANLEAGQAKWLPQWLAWIWELLKNLVLIVWQLFLWPFRKLRILLLGESAAPSTKGQDPWLAAISSIERRHASRGVFDKISVEHVLRRFAELPEVREKLTESREVVEAQLDKIARKYEEFTSSVTADFKRRSKMWSIFIGISLALFANIDATRIYQTYLKDQNLRSHVIGKFEQFEEQAKVAQENLDKAINKSEKDTDESKADKAAIDNKNKDIDKLIAKLKTLTGEARAKQEKIISKEREELQKLIEKAYANSQAGKAQHALNEAGNQLRALSELGVPIGMEYFPHCMLFDPVKAVETKTKSTLATDANRCLPGQEKKNWLLPLIGWIMTAGLTGVLIGLGAPFWFDVARRLAEVRSMFNGQKDNEQRMSGKDVNGDIKERKELVKQVADDATADRQLSEGKRPYRDLLNPEPAQGPTT